MPRIATRPTVLPNRNTESRTFTIGIGLAVELVIGTLGLLLPAPFASAAEPTSIPTPTSRIASASDRSAALPTGRPKKEKPGRDRIQCKAAKSYEGPALGESIPAAQWAAARGSLDHDFPEETAAALQSALDETLVRVSIDRYSVAVGIPGAGVWHRSSPERVEGEPRPWFYWASVAKVFTATAVLGLVEEGKISLDDPVSKWFPKFPNAGAMTIDHLLTHTNGTFSFNEDKKFQKLQGYKHPDQLLELAANHGSRFCPGQNWSYSNTGYLMLAQILEAVEGKPYHEVIRDRLLTPLRIVGIRALAPQETLPGLIAPADNRHGDLETFNYSTPIGAGNLVGDAESMVRFLSALLSGRILEPETVQSMLTDLYPMFDGPTSYGRGLMVYGLPEPSGVTHKWIGHSGGTPGYKAVVAFDLETQAFAAVSFPADLPAEAMAHALFRALPSRKGATP